jgi:hypothetical protein
MGGFSVPPSIALTLPSVFVSSLAPSNSGFFQSANGRRVACPQISKQISDGCLSLEPAKMATERWKHDLLQVYLRTIP